MVAGIFEKSKRLRKVLFFDIQMTPNLSSAAVGCEKSLAWRQDFVPSGQVVSLSDPLVYGHRSLHAADTYAPLGT